VKNITLSADENLIAKARAYAQARHTTVNELMRDYLARISGQLDVEEAAQEFAALAHSRAGRSDEDSTFDRQAIHRRRRPS